MVLLFGFNVNLKRPRHQKRNESLSSQLKESQDREAALKRQIDKVTYQHEVTNLTGLTKALRLIIRCVHGSRL
jgi:hypothetical protein